MIAIMREPARNIEGAAFKARVMAAWCLRDGQLENVEEDLAHEGLTRNVMLAVLVRDLLAVAAPNTPAVPA